MNENNGNSRELKSIRNITFEFGLQMILLLANLISKKMIIVYLGKEFLGLQSLFGNIMILVSFAEMSVGAVIIYSLYNPLAQKDYRKIQALYKYFKKIYVFLAGISAAVGLVFLIVLPQIVSSQIDYSEIVKFYLLYLASTVLYNLYLVDAYMIIADQKRYVYSLVMIFIETGSLILGIFILHYTQDYYLFLINLILKSTLIVIILELCVKRHFSYLKSCKKYDVVKKEDKSSILKNIKSLFVYSFSEVLITGTDNIYISYFINTAYVGMYSNYYFVAQGLQGLNRAIFNSVAASIGSYNEEYDLANQYKIYKVTQIIAIWFIGVTTVCFLMLIQDFIFVWAGDDYLLGTLVVVVIVMNYYFQGIRFSTRMYLETIGIFEKIKKAIVIKAIINIVLSAILGYYFGLIGIITATLLATIPTNYWYESYLVHKYYFRISFWKDIKIQVQSFIGTTFIACVLWWTRTTFVCDNWIDLIIKAIILLVCVMLLFTLLISINKKEFLFIMSAIKKIYIKGEKR